MNKGRRIEIGNLKWKKRLHNYVNGLDIYVTKNGARIYSPKVTDIPKNCFTVLKSTGKPCSCPMCSPGKIEEKSKYKMKLQKPRIKEL